MRSYVKETKLFSSDRSGFPIDLHIAAAPVPLHCHNETELVVVFRGSVTLHVGGESVAIEPNSLLFINSEVLHSLECESSALFCYITLSDEFIAPVGSDISMKYVKPLVENAAMPYILLDNKSLWHKEVYLLAERMISLLLSCSGGVYTARELNIPESDSVCGELEVHCCAAEMWRSLYVNLVGKTKRSAVGNEYVVRRRTQLMTDFIRLNYSREISLVDIAASANISKSEASRCFQTCLRVSPVSYLLRYRTEMAAQLLLNSSKTIEEISFECGFGSASYFCRMFRQYAGVTPGQYRKGVRG